jgi:Arc/MetJ-type ribon-helix-helix transcriptional regulator
MRSVTIELPDTLAQELEAAVESGWFSDEGDAVRQALREFLHRQRRQLEEQFQREDIAWALTLKGASG